MDRTESPESTAGGRYVVGRRRFLSVMGLAGAGALVAGPVLGFASGAAASTGASNTSATPLTAFGLYSYGWDYLSNRAGINRLGTTVLRTSNSGMYDEAWQAMTADGLDVHVTITGTDRSRFGSDDDWIADYLRVVDAYLARWPARWVEIWNEPNFGLWAGASAAKKQAAYGRLLVAAYAHMRSRWPGVGVVGFAAGAASAAAPSFIKGVLQQVPAAATSFDVCSLHPYTGDTAPDQVRQESWGSWSIAGQVQSLRAAGISKPLWFTECGWEVSCADGGTFAKASTSSVVTPDLQAAYRVRLAVLAMSLGVSRVDHMYVVDTDNYNGGFFSKGKARPQAVALSVQQGLISRATTVTTQVATDRMSAHLLHTPSGRVTVAWSDAGSAYSSDVPVGSRIVDLYGRRLGVTSRPHQVLRLGRKPLYLVHAATLMRPTGSTARAVTPV